MKPLDMQTDEELATDLGFRLRKIRIQKNLSQRDVSERAGLTEKSIRNLETGKGSSVNTLVRVLRALDNARAIELLAPTPSVSPLALLRRVNKKTVQQRPSRSRKSLAKRNEASYNEFIAFLEDV